MSKYKLSTKSLKNLDGVHPSLVKLVTLFVDLGIMDISVNEGLRSKERQELLVSTGFSKTMDSKHLKQEDGFGHAVDLYPYPINMAAVNKGNTKEIARFGVIAGVMKTLALQNNIKIRWGGDWDSDGETLDSTFFDAPHIELTKD